MKTYLRMASMLVLLNFLTACIGQFALTKELYQFNLSVSDNMEVLEEDKKFIDEGVFLLLNIPILPIYKISLFVDAIILNSIEFWSDENPMSKTQSVTKQVGFDNDALAFNSLRDESVKDN